jgi:hypothetical protein
LAGLVKQEVGIGIIGISVGIGMPMGLGLWRQKSAATRKLPLPWWKAACRALVSLRLRIDKGTLYTFFLLYFFFSLLLSKVRNVSRP